MNEEVGVIRAILILFLGIYFAIPSQANIGYIIIEALAESSAPQSFLNLFPAFKLLFSLFGVLIVLIDIYYIVDQYKKGNYF